MGAVVQLRCLQSNQIQKAANDSEESLQSLVIPSTQWEQNACAIRLAKGALSQLTEEQLASVVASWVNHAMDSSCLFIQMSRREDPSLVKEVVELLTSYTYADCEGYLDHTPADEDNFESYFFFLPSCWMIRVLLS